MPKLSCEKRLLGVGSGFLCLVRTLENKATPVANYSMLDQREGGDRQDGLSFLETTTVWGCRGPGLKELKTG